MSVSAWTHNSDLHVCTWWASRLSPPWVSLVLPYQPVSTLYPPPLQDGQGGRAGSGEEGRTWSLINLSSHPHSSPAVRAGLLLHGQMDR